MVTLEELADYFNSHYEGKIKAEKEDFEVGNDNKIYHTLEILICTPHDTERFVAEISEDLLHIEDLIHFLHSKFAISIGTPEDLKEMSVEEVALKILAMIRTFLKEDIFDLYSDLEVVDNAINAFHE